jgi:hypothetical protein
MIAVFETDIVIDALNASTKLFFDLAEPEDVIRFCLF